MSTGLVLIVKTLYGRIFFIFLNSDNVLAIAIIRAVDPHSLFADPIPAGFFYADLDPVFFHADPDPVNFFFSMRIRTDLDLDPTLKTLYKITS